MVFFVVVRSFNFFFFSDMSPSRRPHPTHNRILPTYLSIIFIKGISFFRP